MTYDTIKLLEENIGKIFSNINRNSVLLGQPPKAVEIKAEINRTFLVAQWVGICPPVQGMWVQSQYRKIRGAEQWSPRTASEPALQCPCTTAAEPLCFNY